MRCASARFTRGALTALASLCCLALPQAARAWPTPINEAIARDARRLLPRGLAAALAHREEQVRSEMGRLPEGVSRGLAADLLTGHLAPETLAATEPLIDEVLKLFKTRQVGDGLVRLGGLARVPIDLSDAGSASDESLPPRVREEYYLFVQANLDKVPVVLSDPHALDLARTDLPAYWQRLLDDSHREAAVIRSEMLRDGRVVDHRAIDYRSPVFAVAALSYSRAVTAVAGTWLAVWREAHGDLSARPRPTEITPRAPMAPPSGPSLAPRSNSEVR
jgi:hypothetical protein